MGYIKYRTEKVWSWENFEVGDQYGPVVGEVSDFLIKSHAYVVDDYGDWYFKDSTPFGGRIGHPTLLANSILGLHRLGYKVDSATHPGGLHTRNEIKFLGPIFAGTEVTIRGSNVAKHQKRGNSYWVLEGEVVDPSGRRLLWARVTETVGLDMKVGQVTSGTQPDAITGEVPVGVPTVIHASRFVPEGALLPTLTKHTTLEQNIVFSGFRYGWAEGGGTEMTLNVHTDPVEAKQRMGQPDALVQGLIPNAYMSELCTDFFGPLWLTTGRMNVAFIRPVVVRDDIATSGMVKRRVDEGGHTRLELDLWCKNQRGELITVGRASAEVA